jgi:phosphatidylinositol alpha-mannosyltransferase
MQRLRIAQVTEYYYPHLGGVCEHVHFLAREARLRGHHVDIITSNLTGAEELPDVIRVGRSVPVYSNGSMARVTVGRHLRRQLREVLTRGQYDIVHVHAPLSPTLPLMAIDEAPCPVIGTFHT